MKRLQYILAIFFSLAIAYSIGVVYCSLQDQEQAQGNTFTSWTSTLWSQTMKADFQAGQLGQVDVDTQPDNVILATDFGGVYYTSGSLASSVLDAGRPGAEWDALFWDETRPESTNITLWARASDSAFSLDDDVVPWVEIGTTSPVTAGLPDGQYMQWRANLTTSDTSLSPVLHEVRAWYH